ncbi:AMP-binding protein [Streptomyces mirabilis]|uniref:AMP-binding enzyme n=1 Tax=Streptomyces mirabilis TaxID=68239 RepID=A0A1I2L6H0_9ACTN|nr:AMP-binding protein [Streptomyces mirabilis]SFF73057.1 AMP-binding enzyme [Streptomyces mirabilis]
MNLASPLVSSARIHPDRAALRLEDAVVSYRTLDKGSAHMAGLLHNHGVKPGDRVAIMLPNVPEFALAYFGVLRAGGIVVPMNPLLKSREVAYYLGNSGARLLFAWHAFADEARAGAQQAEGEVVVVSPGAFESLLTSAPSGEDLADRHEDDTAVILYTSGTTGQPKGAELTHANLTRNRDIVAGELLQLTADDVIFGGLPLFHAFGQTCTLNAAVASGACLTLLPRFDAGKALGILGEHGVTVFAGVPPLGSGSDHGSRAADPWPGRRPTSCGAADPRVASSRSATPGAASVRRVRPDDVAGTPGRGTSALFALQAQDDRRGAPGAVCGMRKVPQGLLPRPGRPAQMPAASSCRGRHRRHPRSPEAARHRPR